MHFQSPQYNLHHFQYLHNRLKKSERTDTRGRGRTCQGRTRTFGRKKRVGRGMEIAVIVPVTQPTMASFHWIETDLTYFVLVQFPLLIA